VNEDVSIRPATEHVMLVEFRRPPHNYFDGTLIGAIADAYEQLERDGACRAIVLCSEGKNFCAGANFAAENPAEGDLYEHAVRLFAAGLPVVAAVQGAAVGGGLGVALSADFRVASPGSRFSANFAWQGIHHGFGITVTLPLVVGAQRALELLYTGARLRGEDAHRIGLCDRLAASDRLRDEAVALAEEIATSSPWRSGPSAGPCAGISLSRSAEPLRTRPPSRPGSLGPATSVRALALRPSAGHRDLPAADQVRGGGVYLSRLAVARW
jgi:2-(1,2-epoxy-1,2-dihydrophenyl)acetyl-CoA isomerase